MDRLALWMRFCICQRQSVHLWAGTELGGETEGDMPCGDVVRAVRDFLQRAIPAERYETYRTTVICCISV